MPTKTLKPEKRILRVTIILVVILGLLFFTFSLKWFLAHTISTQSQYKELADLSVSLAPDDPQTHYSSAVLLEKTFIQEDLEKSLLEYQKTAALTPNNYLAWLDLGKANERAGNQDLAEKSFRRAAKLAPNYANVKWILGNFLLRSGKTDEGFETIKSAAESDNNYISPFVSIVWQGFDNDIEKTKQIIGDAVKLKSAFSVFLANQKKFDESIAIWNSLPENEKNTTLITDGEAIYNQLLSEKRFLQALEVKSQITEAVNFEIGKINNSSFEDEIQQRKESIFEWTIADGFHPLIGFDDQEKHDGQRSLVYVFNSDDGRDYRDISQTVAIKSGKQYKFRFFYKSALKTNYTLKCEIINAFDGTLIAETENFKTVSDWTVETIDFTVPQNTQGIVIKINREICQSSICPISGKVWLDEFSLTEN